ncbi:hypothetical protein IQ264_13690 [Phormidium sp. LEGE 05292]|uniref:hypothetical protein n=1 Tax=[Phormidium] sp. LEGE 05292 TaxID=767427 RepID=UPI001880E1C4|nr:hypothetical protein [Phormidium sp. LEGE 05292]MBE9226475.1 hypothetical protein [Phormidium sp. LEGE 05292]
MFFDDRYSADWRSLWETAMKQELIQMLQVGTFTLMVGGLFSCTQVNNSGMGILSSNVSVSNISEVKQQSQVNSTVYLKGDVGKLIPFLEKRAYELKDGTDTITVVTKDPFPKQKQEIVIQGKVLYKSVPAGGQEFGEFYIEEQKRL